MMAILFVLIMLVPLSIWRGYVLSVLWGWFIVPLGVPPVGIAWSIGLAVLIGYLTESVGDSKNNDNTTNKYDDIWVVALTKLFTVFLAGLFVLLIGYVAHSFM